MGSAVAVLRDGRASPRSATPEMLYRQPVDAAMARFVGEAVMLPGTVEGGAAICALGRLPLARPAPDGPADVMVRPEQICFVATPSADAPRARVVGGHVLRPRRERASRPGRAARRRSPAAFPGIARRGAGEDVA